jgi:hypothetical protein
MIYRGPGFLTVIWFRSSPIPSPPSVSSTGQAHTRKTGEGVEGLGEDPYHATARNPGPLQIVQYSLNTGLYTMNTPLNISVLMVTVNRPFTNSIIDNCADITFIHAANINSYSIFLNLAGPFRPFSMDVCIKDAPLRFSMTFTFYFDSLLVQSLIKKI